MAEPGDRDNEMIASSMRIPKWIRDALTRLAKDHKRSFNAELIWALERYVEHESSFEFEQRRQREEEERNRAQRKKRSRRSTQ